MSQHDMVVDNGNGAVVLADMQAALRALATCQAGPVEPATPYAGQLWLDTSVPPDGFLRQRNRNNTDWALVLGMPQPASDADLVLHPDGRFLTPADVRAMQTMAFGYARNRVTNGAMQISQENGNAALTAPSAFPADEWAWSFIGGAHSWQRVAAVTPKGSPYRIRLTVTTAKASLAAGDFLMFYQFIEGLRIADFMWGLASARRVILRFGFRGPAGTYTANIRNSAGNRAYVKNFTIDPAQANLDTEQVMVIPGDTTGTWLTDTGKGLQLGICVAAGSTFFATDGTWSATVAIATAATSNGMATVGNAFDLFDVGLYLDLDGSGIPPPWTFPDEAQQLSLCQRYYVQAWSFWCGYHAGAGYNGNYGSITQLPVEMRIAPSLAVLNNLGQSAQFPTTSTLTNLSSSWTGANKRAFREQRNHTATGESSALFSTVVACNARL